MRNTLETAIFFFDMAIVANSRKYAGLKPFTADKVVSLIERLHEHDAALKPSADNKRSTYLAKVTRYGSAACLLISLSDQNAADPAFSNPAKKTRRVVPKIGAEGLEVSSHVVLNINASAPDTYSLIAESSIGLASARIQQFINFLLRRAASLFPDEFQFDDPTGAKKKDGSPLKVKGRIAVQFRGHPSKQLITDINSGTLTGLDLLKVKQAPVIWDQQGYVTEKVTSVSLDVAGLKKYRKLNHFNLIKEICDKAKAKKMDELRVRFKTAAGLYRTVLIDPATQNTNDDAYVKKEILAGFNNPLEAAYNDVNPEVTARMIALLK